MDVHKRNPGILQQDPTVRPAKPKKLPCGYFRRVVTYGANEWNPQDIALIPFYANDRTLAQAIQEKSLELQPVDFYFRDFKINGSGKQLFTHIGNGIGDLFAFSAMAEFLKDYPLQIHIGKDRHEIVRWFKRQDIKTLGYFAPIATNFNPANRLTKYRNLERIAIENAAVEYGHGCWYEAHFKRIGLEHTPPGFDRPHLRTDRWVPGEMRLEYPSVLITHRASCQMRSSKFEDFYKPARDTLPGFNIYVHEVNLTDEDRAFIIYQAPEVRVIPRGGDLNRFLLDVYDCTLLISTDSSALHFREGIERKGIGIYGAMSAESRVKGYTFVKGFNTESDCPHQPCVIHEKFKGQVCPNADAGDLHARCQSGQKFQEQLKSKIREFID